MIISASRRTDIPNYFHKWFLRRVKEGNVLVRNPMNPRQVSSVSLERGVLDGIVFWTKNPSPMIKDIEALQGIPFYFQFTVNPYGKDLESGLPDKESVIIPAFQNLSQKIGRDGVIWRYDPIFLTNTYTVEHHIHCFEKYAKALSPYTDKCVISFLDMYAKTSRNTQGLGISSPNLEESLFIAENFAKIADSYGFALETCAEGNVYQKFGIGHSQCVDKSRFEKIGGFKLSLEKDPSQRLECGCVSSIDIGSYDTCKNACAYCYANCNTSVGEINFGRHHIDSPMLIGNVQDEDNITHRKVSSYVNKQISLFDI